MVLAKYQKIINDIVAQKDNETDPEKRTTWADFELNTRKLDRTTEIQARMEKLYFEGRMIEYLCLAGNYTEFKLKELILSVQGFLALCKKPVLNIKNLEEKTLGELIYIFKNNCINDEELVKRLKSFNSLRIRAIHKLFDTNYQVTDVETEVFQNLQSEDFYREIINPVQAYITRITYKGTEVKYDSGSFPQDAKNIIEKLYAKIKETIGNVDNLDKNLKFLN